MTKCEGGRYEIGTNMFVFVTYTLNVVSHHTAEPDRVALASRPPRIAVEQRSSSVADPPLPALNTGRWGTSGSFDELMANRGIEPVLEGYTEDEGFKWVIDCIEQCLPNVAQAKVKAAMKRRFLTSHSPNSTPRCIRTPRLMCVTVFRR